MSKINDYLKGQINTYCELVRTGKPTAIVPIQDRYIDEAINIVRRENLNYHMEKLSEGWNTLWIYKDNYIIEVIKKLPEKPNTIYDHWVLGKIFGYSDESIRNYLKQQKLI